MKILGIDNIFFTVVDINSAIEFYQKIGFELKFKIPNIQSALFNIGKEEPGLILQQTSNISPSKLWVEVQDAKDVQKELSELNISGKMLEAATGLTFEVTDSCGNIVGFADYCKKPELARKN